MTFILGECLLLSRLKEKGISQAEFARRMECTEAFVSQLIHKKSNMSLEFAIIAAHLLECRVTDFYVLHHKNRKQ
ncbi:helix-turn-helix transcriptional regulator [Paenibacillus camelliae]|uniref:helix-turn-helix transcriptional regulator n=1 Tax=Paenibacillus camelliae TaxID=512410 RepID=UPI00203E5A0D|nr:helix-turn-helix transcriptional regulator [Paenibacillus camelliae]MCM3632906.1 helix-turn-helix domain-containing protein [Paenibacillus camelliae]